MRLRIVSMDKSMLTALCALSLGAHSSSGGLVGGSGGLSGSEGQKSRKGEDVQLHGE